MDKTRLYILNLFDDLFAVKQKISFHLIAQKILDILTHIDFFSMKGAKSKDSYIKMFDAYESTLGVSEKNIHHYEASQVRDDVNKIL